ncbi:MAG: minor capsid protein [Thermoplasmatales archaeon]|nr:minor capsid protein [Thermoplasmatales archaeon]
MKKEPTKTAGIRNNFTKELKRVFAKRFSRLKKKLEVIYNFQKIALKKSIKNLSIDDYFYYIDVEFSEEFEREIRAITSKYIEQGYKKGWLSAAAELKKAGIDISNYTFTTRDLEAIEILQGNGFSLAKGLGDECIKRLKSKLSELYLRGASIQEISKEIRKIEDMSKYRADMIARTETIRAYNEAAVNQYKENEISKWIWVTAFDERTCDECAALDGTEHDYNDERPPAHPLCRCAVAPAI